MLRRVGPLLLLLYCAACASSRSADEPGPESEPETEPQERVIPGPEPGELPPGTLLRTARRESFEAMLPDLAEADLIYVAGDDESLDLHMLELEILEQLFQRGRLHGIGMEIFERTDQAAVDDYAFGRIGESELVERTRFRERWALDIGLYRPVLEFARARRLPILALGLERELKERVRAGGLDALDDAQRGSLPALPAIDTGHRARWQHKFVELLPSLGEGATFEVYYREQRLIEEIMADGLVRWYRERAPKSAQVVVLARRDRIEQRDGLPARVKDRIGKRYVTVVSVSAPGEELPARIESHAFADFVWLSPAP